MWRVVWRGGGAWWGGSGTLARGSGSGGGASGPQSAFPPKSARVPQRAQRSHPLVDQHVTCNPPTAPMAHPTARVAPQCGGHGGNLQIAIALGLAASPEGLGKTNSNSSSSSR